MRFKVVARREGNSVEFSVSVNDIKEALEAAQKEADRIFACEGLGQKPTVAVRKDEGGLK